MDPPATAPPIQEALIEGYEELRRQVLAGDTGMGLAVFLPQGMRSWIETRRSWQGSAAVTPRNENHPQHTVARDFRSEIALLLTSMLLHLHFHAEVDR